MPLPIQPHPLAFRLAAAGLACIALLAGCRSPEAVAPTTAASSPAAEPTLTPDKTTVPFDEPLQIGVTNGTLISAQVTRSDTSARLPGEVKGDTWTSAELPRPGADYSATVSVKDSQGHTRKLTQRWTAEDIPKSDRLTLTISPSSGDVVGVGQPIVVRFDQSVKDRFAFEKQAVVTASVPLYGTWHWVNSREVHFRPEQYWPAHTAVDVALSLNGTKVGPTRWGARDYHVHFNVGDARITTVDAAAHTFTVTVNGVQTAVWPTSLGRPEFATRNGTYVVLEKKPSVQMTSCDVHIQCTLNAPNWYDLTVNWDVRLTWSGTFVHSAPWSQSKQGQENVSHGCVNLSEDNGHAFFDASVPGDVVTVVNSSRGPEDLVQSGDPGMADWNTPWPQYVAGSAIGVPVSVGT